MDRNTTDKSQTGAGYCRGVSLYRKGHYCEAIEQFAAIKDHDGLLGKVATFYEAMAQRAVGLAALREGRYAEAEQRLRFAGRAGRSADMASYLANVYARGAPSGNATADIEDISDVDKDNAESCKFVARTQWRSGQRARAYMTLTEAIRRLGPGEGLVLELGKFYAAEEDYMRARECFADAADVDCSDHQPHYYLALTAAAVGDARTAVDSFQRAAALRPDDIMLSYQLALAANAADRQGHPVRLELPHSAGAQIDSENWQLARFVVAEPDFLKAFADLPQSEADPELFGLLVSVVQMALAEHPQYADLHYYCSRYFARLEQTEPAIYHAEEAVALNPKYVQALIHLADLHSRCSCHEEAADCCRRAISGGGDWPDVHCTLGEMLTRIGQTPEAKQHFSRALELNGNYTRAAEGLSGLAA